MNDKSDKVILAKKALMDVLGDNSKHYLNFLKLWFRQKCTKEEFDMQCRKLLASEQIHLHNKFLLALLNKIGTSQQTTPGASKNTNNNSINNNRNRKRISMTNSSSTIKKRKDNSRHYFNRVNFEIQDMFHYLMMDDLKFVVAPNSTEDDVQAVPAPRFCAEEFFLPDTGFIMGRLLVTAWEFGLINVEDSVSEYICAAVYALLKDILSAMFMKRKHYRVNTLGNYYYDIGHTVHNPFVKNSLKQKIDDGPIDLDKEITSAQLLRKNNDDITALSACQEVVARQKNFVQLSDFYRAIHDRNIIQSHSIYVINLERITQMLP